MAHETSLEGKIIILKSLALSKIVYLALLTIVPKSIIEELNEIQKKFLRSNKKCKIKHGTLCNDYKNGGLKNVDINLKIVSLKSSWIRRLYNECHHDWKIISLNYICKALGKNLKFHSNSSIPNKTRNSLPSYYKDIINSWCKYYSCTPKVSSLVSSQFLWYNSYIKIDKEVVCYKEFADKKINFVSDLFDENGELKSRQKILNDFQLTQKSYFKWFQLIHAIPRPWKLAVLNDKGNCKNIIYLNHHLIKNNQILAIDKLIPKELYSLSIFLKNELPTSQKYFCNIFPNLQVEWKKIYLLPRKVSNDTNLRMFQYKILNNILYLNKQLFIFNKKDTKLCPYCKLQDETSNHIFVECKFAIKLWSDLRHYCQSSFVIPILNPQSAIFGFFETDPDLVILLNHILLLYKYYIYSSRDSSKLSFEALLKNILNIFVLEKKTKENKRKTKAFIKKFCKIMQLGNFMI